MKFIDVHCHLHDERIKPDIEQILERAFSAGISRMICCGSSEKDWKAVDDISRKCNAVVPAFGLHPWYINDRTGQWDAVLIDYLVRHPAAGVGETGLDRLVEGVGEGEQVSVS